MTEAALNKLGKMWVSIMKRKIKQSKKIASGNLYNSISYKVIKDSDGEPIIEISYADYFKYVNQGRKAKGSARPITAANGAVPIPALLGWIKLKGLNGQNERGDAIPDLSLAFAIRANIWKYGIKPADIYDKSLETLESMLDPTKISKSTPSELKQELQKIYEAAAEDINIIVENMIEKELKKI